MRLKLRMIVLICMKKWANSYDQTFAQDRGYNYPAHIAQVLDKLSEIEDSPISDIGGGHRAGCARDFGE
jgi:hypothetical protein